MTHTLHLRSWLKAAQTLPVTERERLILRGSLLTTALLTEARVAGARVPADVDYLVLGTFEPDWVAEVAGRVAVQTGFRLRTHEIIWGETDFPGVRCFLQVASEQEFQVDFAFGDPLSLPPQLRAVLGVPDVLIATPEDLWAWKLHGLVEFGRGRWRGKDLYDLALLNNLPLALPELQTATEVAFGSRHLPLAALTDFMTRPGWGQSISTGRKWRSFLKKSGVQADLTECREEVRAQVRRLWADWAN